MKIVSGLIGAVIGGAIGGAIWAAVVKFTGFEIGWLAWGIGALVGVGFRVGARELANPGTGVLAAAVALLAVLGGKYAVAHLYTQEFMADFNLAESLESDEFVISYIADAVVEEWQSSGRPVAWPDGVDPDFAAEEADYPPAVWTDAVQRWNAMSPDEQQQYRDDLLAMYGDMTGMETAVSLDVFIASFGLFDLLWVFLAVATAFSMGARSELSQG